MEIYSTVSDRMSRTPRLRLHPIVPTRAWLAARPINIQITGQQDQGGRVAGFGGCDVTEMKFSTRVGPPSCSPPV
jgi:hypothetical protein